MAKTKGTVGRTGRTRPDYPIVIDLPPGTRKRPKRPRTKGGGGTGGIIMGIPQDAQPRPEVEWYDNDKRPVKASDRIYAPKQGKNVKTYQTALENIDKTHAVRAEQNPMQLSAVTQPGSGVKGWHAGIQFVETTPGDNQGKVRGYSDIVLNTGYDAQNEPGKRATLYHEIGHGHDYGQNYEEKVIPDTFEKQQYHRRHYDSENAFAKIENAGGSLEPAKGDSEMVLWGKAVKESKTYQSLVGRLEKAKKSGNPKTVEYLEYLTDPKELYARSYMQYVSTKSDPEAMKSIRDQYNEREKEFKELVGYDQWRGKDFDPIEKAFDRLYGSRGLDTHIIARDPRVPIES